MISLSLLACLVAGPAAPPELVTFDEPGFPAVGGLETPAAVEGARSFASVESLAARLVPGEAVLVWRHGATFPADLWAPFVRFLEGGGSFLWLGGTPFDRPVTGPAGAREVRAPNVNLRKALRLNQARARTLPAGTAVVLPGGSTPTRTLGTPVAVTILEPRLTDGRDFEDEDGSPGAREAVVRPLLHAVAPDGDARFPDAALAFAVDRIAGRFAGGRWVLWLADDAPTADELATLVDEATRPALDFRVVPTSGCFHEGETPELELRLLRPGATEEKTFSVDLEIESDGGATRTIEGVRLVAGAAGVEGRARVALDPSLSAPGLHRVTARADGLPEATTGYWGFDRALFRSGAPLSFNRSTLRRDGAP
ncbi:MAG: hypothetical protein ACF8XB_25220, partial [Planctomycetota bacterium JB042]